MSGSTPFELVTDGDLLVLIRRMLHLRGLDTVRLTKVKGYAHKGIVLHVGFGEVDRLGNDAADEAADFGRRGVSPAVIDARRNLSGVCGHWYPVILDLHRFFIAISRAVVNHDGREGTAPDPLVWSAGARPKRRRLVHAVRNHLVFGMGVGSIFLHLLSLLMILLVGLIHQVFWFNGSPFWVVFTGLIVVWILGWWYFLCGDTVDRGILDCVLSSLGWPAWFRHA